MQVKDVMTRNVISVDANESVLTAAQLMLKNRISGLPVIDLEGELVGIVSEGDFLRRDELGTQRRRPKWLEFIVGPGKLAEEYVRIAGRKIEKIMTPDPYTVVEDASLEDVVEMMERRHIKRLPVTRGGRMVGIVSRANLMHALESLAREMPASSGGDSTIRENILAALTKTRWAPHLNVVVKNGVAELWGIITDEREREGVVVAVENAPGVKQVRDHMVFVEPMSGLAFPSAEDEAKEKAAMS